MSADRFIEEQNQLGNSWLLDHNEYSDLVRLLPIFLSYLNCLSILGLQIDEEASLKSYHQLADLLPSRIETYNPHSSMVIPPLIINPPHMPENPLPVPLAVVPPPEPTVDLSAEVTCALNFLL